MLKSRLVNPVSAREKLIRMVAMNKQTSERVLVDVSTSEGQSALSAVQMAGIANPLVSKATENTPRRSGMLALGTDELIPSRSSKTLMNAFQSMRADRDDATAFDSDVVSQIATQAVEEVMEKFSDEKIGDYIDAVLPARVANIFDEIGDVKIDNAILRLAPSQITSVVEKIAPQIISGMVEENVIKMIDEEMPKIAAVVEASVGEMVRQELHGAFGAKVTENIKSLIRIEITKSIAERGN